jgi:hypothetical protein
MIDMLHDHMNRGIGAQLNLSTKITQKHNVYGGFDFMGYNVIQISA